jgi:hypothetical protein
MVNANYCSLEENSQRRLQASGRLRFLSANVVRAREIVNVGYKPVDVSDF